MPYCCYQLIWGKKKSDRKEILIIKKILSKIVDEGDKWLSFRKIPNNRQSMVTASNPKRCYFSPFHKELTSFKVHGLQNTSFAHPSWTFLWKVGTFRAVNRVWLHFAYSVPYQH